MAPSYAPSRQGGNVRPAEIVARFLSRFGDRRYIHSITFGKPPPDWRNYLPLRSADGRPPADQLTAVIHASLARSAPTLAHATADWERRLVFGALRDDFCTAGEAPLVWASGRKDGTPMADSFYALGQRFPNPTPATFRRRLALVGARFGFRVVSLRLLRPEQIAPLLVVKTSRNREQFARDVPQIEALLDPSSNSRGMTAATFEGFFFAAEDAKGPFLSTQSISRGIVEGGQWAAAENLYPYVHG